MFDASAFVGSWPFLDTTQNTLDRLAGELTEVGIKGAALAAAEAILHPEPMAGNLRLIAAALAYRGPLETYVTPIIDPSLPIWREHVEESLRRGIGKVVGIKILPNYHVYSVGASCVHELAELLVERDLALCVQVRMFDERSHHRMMKVPGVPAADIAELANAHPDLRILVCGAYNRELSTYKDVRNVSVEMSFVESGRTIQDAFAALGPSRLLMGTHGPIHYPAAGVSKVFADDLADEARNQLAEANFRALFKPVSSAQQVGDKQAT